MRITVHNAETGNMVYEGFSEYEARKAAREAGTFVLHFEAFKVAGKYSMTDRYERWSWGDLIVSADVSDGSRPTWAEVPRFDFDDEPTKVYARRTHATMFDLSDVR